MRRVGFLIAGVLLFLSLSLGDLQAQTSAPTIQVLSCVVASDQHRAEMEIAFRNDSSEELTSIVWRARYGSGWIDFTDRGGALPGSVVKHRLRDEARVSRAAIDESYYSSGRENCSAVESRAKSGATWRDASAPSEAARIPAREADDAAPIPATIDNPLRDPIGIIGCKLIVAAGRPHGIGRKTGAGVLWIRFRNLSAKPIDRLVIRAAYESGAVDFIFGGTFAPNVLVSSDQYVFGKKMNRLMRDLSVATPTDYTSLDEPGNCTIVGARYGDGTLWQNPTVSPTEPPLPAPETSNER
jgi:hypothetical protein